MLNKITDKIFKYKLYATIKIDNEVIGSVEKRYFNGFKKTYKIKLVTQFGNIVYITSEEKTLDEEEENNIRLQKMETVREFKEYHRGREIE